MPIGVRLFVLLIFSTNCLMVVGAQVSWCFWQAVNTRRLSTGARLVSPESLQKQPVFVWAKPKWTRIYIMRCEDIHRHMSV